LKESLIAMPDTHTQKPSHHNSMEKYSWLLPCYNNYTLYWRYNT